MNTENSDKSNIVPGWRWGNNWPPESVLTPGANHKWVKEVMLDLHEVIVKWREPFCRFCNKSYGLSIDPDKLLFYDMQFDPACGLTSDEFNNCFEKFARLDIGGYGDLEPEEGIKEQMGKIVAAGIKIRIATWTPGATDIKADGAAAYETGIAQHVTKQLIRKLGLPVDVDRDLDSMRTGQKKWVMAERHIPLIVEDNKTTASDVADAAHAVILVPEKYNEGFQCPNVLRLSDRSELDCAVVDFYGKLEQAGVLLSKPEEGPDTHLAIES